MRSGTFLKLYLPFLAAVIFFFLGIWRIFLASDAASSGFNFEVTVDIAFSLICTIAGVAFGGYNLAQRYRTSSDDAQTEFWRGLGKDKKRFLGSYFVDERFKSGSGRGWFFDTKHVRPKGLRRRLWLKHSEPGNDILIAEQDWSELGSVTPTRNRSDLLFQWLEIAHQHDVPAFYAANGEIKELSERQFQFAIFDPGTFQYYFYQHLMRGAALPEDLITTSLNRFALSLDAYEDRQ